MEYRTSFSRSVVMETWRSASGLAFGSEIKQTLTWNAAKIIQWAIFLFRCVSLARTSMCENALRCHRVLVLWNRWDWMAMVIPLRWTWGRLFKGQEGCSKIQTATRLQTRQQTGLTRSQRLSLNKSWPGAQQSEITMALINQRGSGQSGELSELPRLFQMEERVLSYSQWFKIT